MFENMFDFSGVQNVLATATQVANQKNTAEKDLNAVASVESAKTVESAARYEAEAQKALGRLQTVTAKGDEARRMAESDNIFDRITLIGEQILDPRNYTADGRSRQIQEQSQQLAAQGQIFNIENISSEARMNQAKNQYVMDTQDGTAKMNMIRANIEGMQLANAGMAQTEVMRQTNLSQTDLPTIQKILGEPPKPELNGKIAIAGMLYTPAELRERQKNLEVRDALSLLSPAATDPEFASKVRVHQDLQLANYSLPELEALKANKYIMPDGNQVDPGTFDQHYARQTGMQQAALNTMMNQHMLENQVPTMIAQSGELINNLQTYAQPGTPLGIAKANFQAAANTVATLAAQDATPNGKIVQVTALQKAQEQLVKAVDNEAVRKAAGDRALADIYRDQMLGQPIQPSQVEDVIRGRYIKGNGFGEILPNEVSQRVRKNADVNFAALKVANAKSMDPMAPTKSDKEVKEEAINQAIEQERQTSGIVGINLIQQSVGQRKDNPAIKAGMVPASLFETQTRAHTMALNSVAEKEGLTQAQILALKNGKPQDAGLSPEKAALIAQQVNIESVMNEYDLMEKTKPGLGWEMQQWYATTLPEMARNYTQNMDPIQKTLTGDSVLTEAQKLAQMYTIADESATDRGKKMAVELSTGARKPENMWPVLLQNQKTLADSQKQSIYFDVIKPAIEQARSQGATDEVATNMVFEAMTQYKSDDPTMMSAIRTLQRGLPEELDRFQTMWASIMMKDQPNPVYGRRVSRDPELAKNRLDSVIPWLTQK